MAVDAYTWPVQRGAGAAKYSKTVRSVQFDDGYTQDAEQGMNSTMIECPLMHVGKPAEVMQVRDFLLGHMVKAFVMTPPGGEPGLYKVAVDSVTVENVSVNVAIVAWTVKRAYGVYA